MRNPYVAKSIPFISGAVAYIKEGARDIPFSLEGLKLTAHGENRPDVPMEKIYP